MVVMSETEGVVWEMKMKNIRTKVINDKMPKKQHI